MHWRRSTAHWVLTIPDQLGGFYQASFCRLSQVLGRREYVNVSIPIAVLILRCHCSVWCTESHGTYNYCRRFGRSTRYVDAGQNNKQNEGLVYV